MLLVQEPILSDIWAKHQQGVPISALIRQEQLKIANPTLTTLLGYVTALEDAEQSRLTDIYQVIYDSLFPEWLTEKEEQPTVVQPKTWYYTGTMPLGKWVRR